MTRFASCPLVKGHDLVRNGGYDRWFWDEGEDKRSRVYRKFCRKCRVSFSLLPGDALAWWAYPCSMVGSWLLSAMHGRPHRDRAFMVAQGGEVPEPAPGTSWSDERDQSNLRPSRQLLCRWSRELRTRAARLLPLLVNALVLLDVDLRTVAEVPLASVQRSFMPLAVALGCMSALNRFDAAPEGGEYDPMADLVRTLVRRPLAPSHRVVRVSHGRLRYDSLVT